MCFLLPPVLLLWPEEKNVEAFRTLEQGAETQSTKTKKPSDWKMVLSYDSWQLKTILIFFFTLKPVFMDKLQSNMQANSYRQVWNCTCRKEAENVRSSNFYKGWQDREEKAFDKSSNFKEEPCNKRLPVDSAEIKSWFLRKNHIMNKSF